MASITTWICSSRSTPSSSAPSHDVIPIDGGGERLLFHLLADAFRLQSLNPFGAHDRAGADEAGQFVAGIECFVEERNAWRIGHLGGMRLDGVDDVLRIAALGQYRGTLQGMVRQIGPAFVVEIVQQARRFPTCSHPRRSGGRRPAAPLRRPACAGASSHSGVYSHTRAKAASRFIGDDYRREDLIPEVAGTALMFSSSPWPSAAERDDVDVEDDWRCSRWSRLHGRVRIRSRSHCAAARGVLRRSAARASVRRACSAPAPVPAVQSVPSASLGPIRWPW